MKESLSKEKSIDKIPVKQTVFLKQKIKRKTLDDLGEIEEAKKHRSANRPLHKIKEFNSNVNFCWCCNLPCEEKGIIEPFHYCDSVDKFSECGLGVSFYFYFFRFLILILFISICGIIISMMVFNKHYTKGINRVCNNSYKKLGYNNLTLCEGYVTEAEEDLNIYARFMKDGVLTYSSDNIKIYYLLHNSITNQSKNAEDVIINHSVLNFLLLFSLFIINIGYIILINARTKKEKSQNLSIRDYTVLVSNSKHILFDYLNQIKKQNLNYIAQSQIYVENTDDFIKYVNKYITENDYKVYNINMCYNLGQYMDLRDELEECKNKIFKIKNDKNIIEINTEKGNLMDNRCYYKIPLKKIGINCIKFKDKPLITLEKQKSDLEKQIEFEINNFQILSESNFTGYMFVSFNYIKDKEEILKQYPNHFFDIFIDFIKNIKYYLCCCCIGKGEKMKFRKKKGINIEDPPEPEDLYFENFKYSGRQRFLKIVLFFFVCILIIGVSLAIVLGFTYWQDKVLQDNKKINLFVKYLFSIFITIVTTIINEVVKPLLEKFTFWECHLSRTNYYLSLSVKIAIFTFFNSAIVPLIAKHLAVKKRIKEINYNIDRNNLIVDDMFMMFLANAILTPIFWTFVNIPYLIRRLRICLIEKNKEPDKHHYMTQKKLNKLYEYRDMDISYKYAYLAKTTAMSLFYLPIFPIGFIISFLGFVLGYFLELYNFTHNYKRPEMLDETISKSYANYFIVILFIGGVGDLFFFYEIFPSRGFSLANFIIFLVLIFVPYTKFLKCNFIGEKEKSEYYPQALSDIYFKFYNDYQRQNPFTKKLGLTNYLTALKEKGYLSKNAFNTAMANIDKLNLMEIYYGISRGNIPQIHQSIMANTNNKSISGNNINIRQSLVNPNINDDEEEKIRKQKYFDSQINIIFGNKYSLSNVEAIEEEPEKFPWDTVDEEGDTKDKLINAYNNPLAINMGLGPLPMDNNIFKSIPLTLSKRATNNNYENETNNIQSKNSQEISVKIKNDIENYRKKKKNDNINDITESSLNIQKSKDEHIENNNFAFSKNEYDSDSKEINVNMPFKASINQSQNEKVSNSLLNKNSNSLNKEKKQEQEQEQNQDHENIGYISSNVSLQNMNEIDEKENSDNIDDVNNNFENLFDIESSENKLNKNNNMFDINTNDNLGINNINPFPMDEISNNNKENKNDLNLLKNNLNNISDIRISKSSNNEEIINSDNKDTPNMPNLDNDKVDMNLSKSQNSDIKDNNNNELDNENNSEDEK